MPRRESRSRWSYRAMVVPVPALGLFIVDNATAQRVRVACSCADGKLAGEQRRELQTSNARLGADSRRGKALPVAFV